MLKIHCPECGKEFIWTDDMPPRGGCPNPDCEAVFDVHRELRRNLEGRGVNEAAPLRCPACGGPIRSRWSVCGGCGRVVAGTRSFRKRHLLIPTAVALLLLSLAIRLWIR